MLLKLFLMLLWLGLSALVTWLVYSEEHKYYKELQIYKTKEDEDNKKPTNIHSEFEIFQRKDNPVSLIRVFLGCFFMFWIKFPLAMGSAILCKIKMKQVMNNVKDKNNLTREERDKLIEICKYYNTLFLRFSGIPIKFYRLEQSKVEPVYKKYLGEDVKISYEGNYGCHIANHVCFIDTLLAMKYFACGFISKDKIKKVPVFSGIAECTQTIFVERDNPNSRQKVLTDIEARMNDFYQGKNVMPLMIFPEGTTSSNRHILPFKKGAFVSLLPVKPSIIKANEYSNFHVSCGATGVGWHYFRGLCELFTPISYIELPIITPTEYMFETYKDLGEEKWEIFANVARNIFIELGEFQRGDAGLRESFRYERCLKDGKYYSKEQYDVMMKENQGKYV